MLTKRYPGSITDISGIRVGTAEDRQGLTGCTAILLDQLTQAGVDVRGGGPGTYCTDILSPYTHASVTDCIVLAGGSRFGLDCMSGAVKWLEDHDRGFDTGIKKVPMVNGAIIFDLGVGDANARPTPDMAYAACEAAGTAVPQGAFGAGCGATVGKVFLEKGMEPGGMGTACIDLGGGLLVGALAVVNALGDVYDGEDCVAGLHDATGKHIGSLETMLASAQANVFGKNTTISVVATNMKLDRGMTTKLAMMAHDGYARAIRPVHTLADGDTVFSVCTNEIEAPVDINRVLAAAGEVMRRAIVNAVLREK